MSRAQEQLQCVLLGLVRFVGSVALPTNIHDGVINSGK